MGDRSTWNFYSAGRLIFGRGAVREVGPATAALVRGNVLIVTDRTLVEAGIVAKVEASLQAAGLGVAVFDGGQPEPPIDVAREAFAAAGQQGARGIVGVGGGSNMDLAKIVAVLLTHGGRPEDWFGWNNVPAPVVPLVCVPTTSGTGSEVSHAAVLTDTANAMKVSTLSNHLRPRVAVVDPELTLSCPPRATADSGIDALTHAIEAYTATHFSDLDLSVGETYPYDGSHPLGDLLAERAIALVGEHLVTAVGEPANLAAREGMSLAATLAGLAFSNCGVAVVHALEYPIGADLHCSHGAGNGLLLPYVMRFNLPARTERLARIAALLGEDVAGLATDAAAERAIVAVERLRAAIGIPHRIRDLAGVRTDTEAKLPAYADKSFAVDRLMKLNGRRPTRDDLLAILRAAY
jgi:alcohol dehydrogenase